MYKIVIADDEPLVQVGIKSMLDRLGEEFDIEVSGTAPNGEVALKLIEEHMPDIVITDIKMPILSGLELAKRCREMFGKLPAFIILTSYEDFKLAREALSYQVCDYLIKLELNMDMLRDSLKKAIAQVDENRPASGNNDEFVMDSLTLLRERFLVKLVNNIFDSSKDIDTQQNELGITFSSEGSMVGYFEILPNTGGLSGQKLISLYSSAFAMFRQLLVKYIDSYVVFLDGRHFMVIFGTREGDLESKKASIRTAVSNTCQMLKNYYNTVVLSGIGRLVYEPADMYISYTDARQMLSETEVSSPILFYDDLGENKHIKNIFSMTIFKDDIRMAFDEMNAERLRNVADSIIELFNAHPTHYAQAMDAASSILYFTISFLPNGERVVSDIFSDREENYRSLYTLGSTDQVIEWMNKLIDGLSDAFNSNKHDYRAHTVAGIKAYINENIDKKLSLNEVAAVFSISPTYLSNLFGKYSDMGFVDYVNQAKISAAKKMLESNNYKIYEIADKLGFESAFYFSKVFKKVEGCSPRDYIAKM